MNKRLFLILLPALLSATGCKQQKASETKGTITEVEAHQPLPPQYTAHYDKSVTPGRIDIEKALADSVPVNLSKVASSIEYFMVGDDKYPITDVVATNEGFIALNQPKLYLYRKGMKRKRVGLKTTYGNWINVPGSKISFDTVTTRLYAHLKRINQETGYGEEYIAELPPLDSVLARVYYLYPDSLPNRYFFPPKSSLIRYLSPDKYATQKENKDGIDEGITLFHLNGDTICTFTAGIDPTTQRVPTSLLRQDIPAWRSNNFPLVFLRHHLPDPGRADLLSGIRDRFRKTTPDRNRKHPRKRPEKQSLDDRTRGERKSPLRPDI